MYICRVPSVSEKGFAQVLVFLTNALPIFFEVSTVFVPIYTKKADKQVMCNKL